MKLQVTQENLSRALSSVARVASSRNSLPILANVLIKTSNNRLVCQQQISILGLPTTLELKSPVKVLSLFQPA